MASRLAGYVAHEINNPLLVVMGNISAIRDYSSKIGGLWLAAKSAAEYLRALPVPDAGGVADALVPPTEHKDIDRLIHDVAGMVDDIMEGVRRIGDLVKGFSRLAQSEAPRNVGEIELAPFVAGCVNALGGQGVRNVVTSIPAGLFVRFSPDDLRASVCALLLYLSKMKDSADRRSRLSVSAEADDKRVRLSAVNPDAAATSDELPHLFDPRLEVARKNSGDMVRLDLSLAIAYQLLTRGGATISTQVAESGGVEFRIEFPGAKPAGV
ncbi:hypothetical protein K8I61_00750 [bacterium]|nr:hypothetical protein [bacterium]